MLAEVGPYLAGAMWFFVLYMALGYLSDHSLIRALASLRLGGVLERRVQALAERSKRSQQFAGRLQRILQGSRIGRTIGLVQFLLLSLLVGIGFSLVAVLLLNNMLAALLLALVGIVLPYQLLDLDYMLTRQRLQRQGVGFLLTVLNLYSVYPDPAIALEHAVPTLPEPMAGTVRWFTTACRHGMPLVETIALMKERMPDPTLQAFWDDVAFYMQRGGPFHEAVADHVTQLYDRGKLASERSVSAGSTLAVFGMLVGVYLVLLTSLTRINPYILTFMTTTPAGRIVVTVMISIFVAAAYYLKTMSFSGGDT